MENIFEIDDYQFIMVNQDSCEIMTLNKYGQYVVFTKKYLEQAAKSDLWDIEKIVKVANQFIFKTETRTFHVSGGDAAGLWQELYENAPKLNSPYY